jgi:hypothetical protein
VSDTRLEKYRVQRVADPHSTKRTPQRVKLISLQPETIKCCIRTCLETYLGLFVRNTRVVGLSEKDKTSTTNSRSVIVYMTTFVYNKGKAITDRLFPHNRGKE